MTLEGNRNIEKVKKCPACNRRFTGTMVVCQHDGSLLIPVKQDELLGTLLAEKYLIIEEIGRGGMSIVYKGRHELMDRTVAVKMLQSQLVEDQTSIKRFQQEAKAASCLTHPNVITVFDFGIAPTGQPYLVMDYLEGESLIDIIKRDNHVPVSRALYIFIQACDALEHAHQKGVLHRDLKSSNIMLIDFEGKRDVVKVVDFGIAKLMPSSGKQSQNLTQTGEIFGSPIYMSPEQCLGQPLDVRSDVYSMGTMLYESLTGDPPLMGDTVVTTMQMHVATQPAGFDEIRPDLYIPPLLEAACMKALQKKPGERFQSMEEFKLQLQRIQRQLESDPGPAAVPAGAAKQQTPRSTVQNLTGQRPNVFPQPSISDNREVRKPTFQPSTGGGTGSRMAEPAGKLRSTEASGGRKSPLIVAAIIIFGISLLLILGLIAWKMTGH